MGGFTLAWLTGEAIVCWRWGRSGAPPTPGSLALSSIVFVALAALAEYQPARTFATVVAWGVDLAILLQVLPGSSVPAAVNWPPALINDPAVLLPTGTSSSSSSSNPANTPAAVGGANAANGAPASTPANPGVPPTGAGTIYPPGSQNI